MSVHCGEVSVEEFDSQLPQQGTLGENVFYGSVLLLAERTSWRNFQVDPAVMVVEASVASQKLSGRAQTSLTKLGQLLTKSIRPHGVKHLRRIDFEGSVPRSRPLAVSEA